MTTHTTIRSWRALGVAGVILAGTCFILFQDVLNGAAITTGHVLTALALLIATAAGHQIVPTFKAGRYALTLSMIVLAIGAIAYIGLMSGARNAEQTATKAERIEGANTQRAAILAERKAAQDMLDAARAAIARECASGEGSKCRGRRATEAVYTAAVAGHDAKLDKLGAPGTANAGYKAIAEGIVLLPWFTHHAVAEVERALIILLPWLAVLLAELSLPAFLSLALGHAVERPAEPRGTHAARAIVPDNDPEPEPPGGPRRRHDRGEVIDWIREQRARAGRNPTLSEISSAFGYIPKTTCSRIRRAA